MGMFTELIFGADFKQHTPDHVIEALKYMIGDTEEKPNDFPFPEGRWKWLFKSSSYYFGVNEPVIKMWYDTIGKNWVLSIRCSIKNYQGEIDTFLKWIKPHIDGGSGRRDMYAIVTYEGVSEPTIYYLR